MTGGWDWRWAWQGALRDTIATLPPLPPVEPRNQFTVFHEEVHIDGLPARHEDRK